MGRAAVVLFALLMGQSAQGYSPQAGDIVFHTSLSSQSRAVQLATKSRYSHMGIVLFRDGQAFVLEAVQPVRYTPLQQWLDRGKDRRYVIKRLKTPWSEAAIKRLQQDSSHYEGKPYDLAFEWSDNRIYCSELVWKLYKSAAGIELAPLSKLGDFDLSHPSVQTKLKERYGNRLPLAEPVIAPAAIFESPLLRTVSER
ncbi:YiiX family permuted papain-like enzyme [Uliginosibacterium aquaticum]|uniref:YiiX family permuted papain-like enzyme n=1 Tax=Uliginosibacterium aquaticum TaxID=2731212 RepID=A0ABX2INU0_9RHOO|nr:YiiX family permuted papain-like enzyme [Uliginosibacterium aquaticum]NSL55913.1 YiiX family permuted papain-like enzyme [Uliginosibacterium aquaticum]